MTILDPAAEALADRLAGKTTTPPADPATDPVERLAQAIASGNADALRSVLVAQGWTPPKVDSDAADAAAIDAIRAGGKHPHAADPNAGADTVDGMRNALFGKGAK